MIRSLAIAGLAAGALALTVSAAREASALPPPFINDAAILGEVQLDGEVREMPRTLAEYGFFLDAGWGTWGFKATPISGKTMAATVAGGRDDPLIAPFNLSRFERLALVGEKGAAAVGH